jgi:carboxymethylenebutenolidase
LDNAINLAEFFIPPTGRRVAVPHVVVMKFEGDKIAHEHIYWDQACVLAQVGLLDPAKLPVTGARQAEALVEKSRRPHRAGNTTRSA